MIKVVNLHRHVQIKSSLKKQRVDPEDKSLENKHFSVGALIKRGNKYLIINRNIYPQGYAGIAGHIKKNEKPIEALKREVKEETNYDLMSEKLLFHEIIKGNECRSGIKIHEWYLYECICKGKLKITKREEKSIQYLTKEEINKFYKQRKLEPVWEYWFEKLKLI